MLSQFLRVSSWVLGTMEMGLPQCDCRIAAQASLWKGKQGHLEPCRWPPEMQREQRYDPGQTAPALGVSTASPAQWVETFL